MNTETHRVGCNNRPPFIVAMPVQDGWFMDGVIPFSHEQALRVHKDHAGPGRQGLHRLQGEGSAVSSLTCASCGRRITKIAAALGRAPLGPVCAKRMNLIATKNRATSARVTRAKPQYREENQMDLFEELIP